MRCGNMSSPLTHPSSLDKLLIPPPPIKTPPLSWRLKMILSRKASYFFFSGGNFRGSGQKKDH